MILGRGAAMTMGGGGGAKKTNKYNNYYESFQK